jgi:nucleotide-binding universal stress UspA family protein
MTWRKIMVPVIAQSGAEALERVSAVSLDAGLALGRMIEAHVEVCCLAAGLHEPHEHLFAGVPGSAIELLTNEIDKRNAEGIAQAREFFARFAAQYAPTRDVKPGPSSGFSAEIVEIIGRPAAAAAERARLSDAVVLAMSAQSPSHAYERMVRGVLTESGRPLLVVPVAHQALSLERVALAWNGSLEAARAASLAMPLIERAEELTVIAVQEDGPISPDVDAFADYLRWHGNTPDCVSLDCGPHAVGEVLQEEAVKAGAGILVMGAYTRSRLSRIVLGGATGAVLHEPRLPVVMAD